MNLNKKIAALAVATGIIGTTGVAYAYWTTTGSGEGSATAAASNGTLVLHADVADGIYPGGSVSVTFTADNDSATRLFAGTIHLESVEAEEASGVTGECDVADFSMVDVESNTIVAEKTDGVALAGTGTLLFANSDVNQDACKGAEITLNVSSN